MSRTIRVFEHESLTLRPQCDPWGRYLTKDELEKLYAFNDKNDNKYFTGIREGVKFKNFVGVIQIGGLTLEILPKADKRRDGSTEEHEMSTLNWRNALLRMLAICHHIDLESVSEANLERRHYSILDLYFEIFLAEVQKLLHRGLVRKYRASQGNLPVLKGRVDFSRNIQHNLIHQERFFTHHQVYDQDHLINQILLRALNILDQLSIGPLVKDKLTRVMLDFPQIRGVRIQAHHFDSLVASRKTAPYEKALQIAKMIILNYSPDIRGGNEDMLALLFDMNKLWEEYIYRILVRSKELEDAEVNFQNSKPFWESKTIRPDIVIQKGSETIVVDTKWKVIDSIKPDDGDLKQIFAYNLYWKSYRGYLLYPSSGIGSESVIGTYHKGHDKTHGCTLSFVEVLDTNGKLDVNCGARLCENLFPS